MKNKYGSHPVAAALGATLALCMAVFAHAGPVERAQAKRIHDRIAGVPPSAQMLDQMEQDLLNQPGHA